MVLSEIFVMPQCNFVPIYKTIRPHIPQYLNVYRFEKKIAVPDDPVKNFLHHIRDIREKSIIKSSLILYPF